MPIDANIPLQVKPFNIQLPVNQLAAVSEAMKIGEMNRGIDTQNKLRELYSQGVDVSTPEGFNKLASVDPSSAIKLRRDALEGVKLQGDIKKTGVETKIKELEVQREQFGNLVFNPSNANVTAHIEDSVLKGNIPPAQAQALLAQVMPMNADQRKQFFTDMAVKAETRFQGDITKRGQDISASTARRGQDIGRIPVGYRMSADGKNLEAMPGGPTTVPLAPKELQAREAKYPMATQAVKTVESKADKLIADLETLKNHPGLPSITGTVYGRTPSVTAEGRQAQALYDSIVARGGFQELAAMRAASPTGGALGNVSNQEGQQLKDAFGTLNRTQDAADLRTQLGRVADDVRGAKTRVREAYDMTYDYRPGTAPSGGGGGGKDDPLGIR